VIYVAVSLNVQYDNQSSRASIDINTKLIKPHPEGIPRQAVPLDVKMMVWKRSVPATT
jgi:hypothetical protein